MLKRSASFSKVVVRSFTMLKPRVLVTRSRQELPKTAIEILEKECLVEYPASGLFSPPELLKKIESKDGLLCLLTEKIDKRIIEAAGDQLKVVSTLSVGYDHLDVDTLKLKGIKVGYTPNVLNDAVADLAVALLLATNRRLLEANNCLMKGDWPPFSLFWMAGRGLSGSTVGIFGLGRIGVCILKRLLGFNVRRFLYNSRQPKPSEKTFGAEFASFEELMKESDFIICSASSTPETNKVFNESAFKLMKSSAVFINVARGDLVDQEALMKALNEQRIGAAGLDVMTPEPIPTDHPLLKCPNLTLLPHIGSAEVQTREAMACLAASNLVAGLNGTKMPSELIL